MTTIRENLNESGWRRKMGGIDAKKPKPGMKIRGKFGIYKLTKEIGGGGNGTVFSVEVISAEKQLPEKENFVVKILKYSSRPKQEREKREKRFEREVRYVYQIQHEIEGIIPIYDSSYFLEKRESFAWYLMPKASTYNFKGIHSTEEKLIDMRDIGECVVQLHKRGLVHRDIKPKNLLVYNNRVCLADFGLVRNMDEAEEHITDIHENMGPGAIRPPEMWSIENPDNIDYQKSDVYLFAKTVWIILTGVERGFIGEYKRSGKSGYLDKKKLGVETAEPLHEMLESATKHYWWERIDIRACVQHIDNQLNIIAKTVNDVALGKWKYIEIAKEVWEDVPNIKVFQDAYSIQKILEKMAGTANLLFEEAGKSYEPMFLKSVKILPDKLFEMEVRNIYGNRKIINVEIEKISLMKDLSCIMDTKVIVNQPNNMPLFTNLNKALQSLDKQICISGMYGIRLVQTSSPF